MSPENQTQNPNQNQTDQTNNQSRNDNPFLEGERVRNDVEKISQFVSLDGGLTFERQTSTVIHGIGQFETNTVKPSMFLPEGTRVGSAEEISHLCSKYRPNKRGCGPLTQERVYWCARCARPFCVRHTWQAIFSQNRYCLWCFGIRGVEVFFRCIGAVCIGIALAIAWAWKSWWGIFAG